MKLKGKILIPVLLLVAVGMSVMAVFLFVKARAELRLAVDMQLELVSEELVIILDQYLLEEQSNVAVFSGQPVFRDLLLNGSGGKEANDELRRIMGIKPEYENLALLGADGTVISCNDPAFLGVGLGDREYFKLGINGETNSSDVVKSRGSGNPVIVFAAPVYTGDDRSSVAGVFIATVDLSVFTGTYVDSITVGNSGYAYMLGADGVVLAHPSKEKVMAESYARYDFVQQIILEKKGHVSYDYDGITKTVGYDTSAVSGWILAVTADDHDIYSGIDKLRFFLTIMLIVALLVSAVVVLLIAHTIVKPIKHAVDFAGVIASGDLRASIGGVYLRRKDEIGMLANALQDMKDRLSDIVQQVSSASAMVSQGSEQLAVTAEQMSQGAAEQASTAEEVSSSIEEISASIRLNADNAAETEQIASKAATDAAAGGDAVADAVLAMREISDKIEIIDQIARNTNILSLNAAIEAARAGEHGKGFAVVASEVGKLAANSQKAAAEIMELVSKSANTAENAGHMIADIVPGIRKTADLVQEISATSVEQNTGAEQISQVMMQLDQVIQQNAAASEESSSMSEELSSQADALMELMSFFSIGMSTAAAAQQPREFSAPAPSAAGSGSAGRLDSPPAAAAKAQTSSGGRDASKQSGGERLQPAGTAARGGARDQIDDEFMEF